MASRLGLGRALALSLVAVAATIVLGLGALAAAAGARTWVELAAAGLLACGGGGVALALLTDKRWVPFLLDGLASK